MTLSEIQEQTNLFVRTPLSGFRDTYYNTQPVNNNPSGYHYRKDFGMALTDEDYQALIANQKTFNEEVSGYQEKIDAGYKEIEDARSKLTPALNAPVYNDDYINNYLKTRNPNDGYIEPPKTPTKGMFSFYDLLIKDNNDKIIKQSYIDSMLKNDAYAVWRNNLLEEKTVPFNIYDNGKLVATYRVIPEDFETLKTSIANAAGEKKGPPWLVNEDGMDIRGYGKEIFLPLADYSTNLEMKLADSWINGAKNFDTSPEVVAANEQLSNAQDQINKLKTENTTFLNTIQLKYKERLSTLKDTINGITVNS